MVGIGLTELPNFELAKAQPAHPLTASLSKYTRLLGTLEFILSDGFNPRSFESVRNVLLTLPTFSEVQALYP